MNIAIDKFKAFFFDFDGVMVDSIPLKARAFGSLFEKYGPDIVHKVMDYHLRHGGVSRYEKFKYYYEELLKKPITAEIMADLDREFSLKVKQKVIEAPLLPGVLDFFKALQERKKMCFVVSGTPQLEICDIIFQKGLSDVFKDVVGSPKAKDENLAQLLKKYSIASEDAIYFGDATSDYEAAKKNKIIFIGVVDQNNKELSAIKGINRIRNFKELSF